MAKNTSTNLETTINADGFAVKGGTTRREFALIGGDVLATGGDVAVVSSFPGIANSLDGNFFSQTATLTLRNSSGETSILSSGVGTKIIPASLFTVGSILRLSAMGVWATDSVAPTIRLKLKFGSTIIVDTGIVNLAASISFEQWAVDVFLTCRSIGAAGTVLAVGVASGKSGFFKMLSPDSSSEDIAPVTVDTTVAQTVDLTAQWGTANTANSLWCSNVALKFARF